MSKAPKENKKPEELSQTIKIRFIGLSPHIAPGYGEVEPGEEILVSPELAEVLLKGLFEKVSK